MLAILPSACRAGVKVLVRFMDLLLNGREGESMEFRIMLIPYNVSNNDVCKVTLCLTPVTLQYILK